MRATSTPAVTPDNDELIKKATGLPVGRHRTEFDREIELAQRGYFRRPVDRYRVEAGGAPGIETAAKVGKIILGRRRLDRCE
jgi:hypothetical protein